MPEQSCRARPAWPVLALRLGGPVATPDRTCHRLSLVTNGEGTAERGAHGARRTTGGDQPTKQRCRRRGHRRKAGTSGPSPLFSLSPYLVPECASGDKGIGTNCGEKTWTSPCYVPCVCRRRVSATSCAPGQSSKVCTPARRAAPALPRLFWPKAAPALPLPGCPGEKPSSKANVLAARPRAPCPGQGRAGHA